MKRSIQNNSDSKTISAKKQKTSETRCENLDQVLQQENSISSYVDYNQASVESEKNIEESHLSESIEEKVQESSVSSGTTSKDREAIFAKAEKYIDKIYSDIYEVDAKEKDAAFAEYQKKLKVDIDEAELAVVTVCAWAAWPKKMDMRKNEQLEMLIDKNNKGEINSSAVIGFLTELFTFHDWEFEDFDGSWHNSLDYIHKESENLSLVGLVDELFG